MEVQVREEEGLAFQYHERITGRALDGWSLRSYTGLRVGCIKAGEERGMNIEVEGWREVSGIAQNAFWVKRREQRVKNASTSQRCCAHKNNKLVFQICTCKNCIGFMC